MIRLPVQFVEVFHARMIASIRSKFMSVRGFGGWPLGQGGSEELKMFSPLFSIAPILKSSCNDVTDQESYSRP